MHYGTDRNVYDEDIPKIVRQKLRKDGWVIISYNVTIIMSLSIRYINGNQTNVSYHSFFSA